MQQLTEQNPLIQFKKTSFAINDRKIINAFTANIYPGDFVVILGGNGSGKSTLLKLINRTYHHTSGDIIFKNKSIGDYDFKSLQREMVTITQFISDSVFTDLTIEENALLIESSYLHSTDQPFCKKTLLKELPHYLLQFNPQLAKALKTRLKNLSGGEQQILAFALYLRRQPDLLLLDEHTSALDPKKSDSVMAFTHAYIQKKRITCLMTTHQLDYALKYGNRLMAIREGELAFDAKSEQKSTLSMTDLLTYCY